MRSVAALLAAALGALALAGCGSGAEPGASSQATLVLDFTPNAVHSGIYAALKEGYYANHDVDLSVREPSSSTDAPKLLEAGRAQFAILDIHDLAIADERGLNLVGVAPIVERPLAAVIAGDRSAIRTPADLAGKTIGVTGLPSDDAVLNSVLASAGLTLDDVHRVTIGFNAVADLAAGKVDAATAFWNAEGVTLQRRGIPTRVFRVDDFGAPRYPELILTTTRKELHTDPPLVRDVVRATREGYELVNRKPSSALSDLLADTNGLDESDQRAELNTLLAANTFRPALRFGGSWQHRWSRWEASHGIVSASPDPNRLFDRGFYRSRRNAD
jgi:ABC-type nitrate/sulfonate/bicarbonate transport system substrate-binding protein